jgi:hypothetical protein
MFEVEHLLVALIAALMQGDAAAFIADFDVTRIKSHFDRLAGWSRRRIKVRPHPHAAKSVDARKRDIRQLEALPGERK